MPTLPPLPIHDDRSLRRDAELRLREGTAPPTKGWTVSADSLALLYRLASSPDSASDALKLLHELQVYQVELDLQQEQLAANERDLAQSLARYKAFYDDAPFGYLILALDSRILEANAAAAHLLGVEQEQLRGCRLASRLAPASQLMVAGVMKRLHDATATATCEVQSLEEKSGSQRLRIAAHLAPDGESVLMALGTCD